jgi:hypothetical protein
MLADTVEAASRSLEKPTPNRIAEMVETLMRDKLLDGQLDHCPLTLEDLHEIRASFVFTLTNILHGRNPYPREDQLAQPAAGAAVRPAAFRRLVRTLAGRAFPAEKSRALRRIDGGADGRRRDARLQGGLLRRARADRRGGAGLRGRARRRPATAELVLNAERAKAEGRGVPAARRANWRSISRTASTIWREPTTTRPPAAARCAAARPRGWMPIRPPTGGSRRMILKDEAIALRIHPFGNTSRIVVWLSQRTASWRRW